MDTSEIFSLPGSARPRALAHRLANEDSRGRSNRTRSLVQASWPCRAPGARRLPPLLALAFALGGCASGHSPRRCGDRDPHAMPRDSRCWNRATWSYAITLGALTGSALERDGHTLFVVNRGLITAAGTRSPRTTRPHHDLPRRGRGGQAHPRRTEREGRRRGRPSRRHDLPSPDGELPTLVFAARSVRLSVSACPRS